MSHEVYFEAQDEETSLCGQHAINNLLQGAYFTAIDLGRIGSHLDEQESNLYTIDEDTKQSPIESNPSNNVTLELPSAAKTFQSLSTRDRQYSNVSMTGLFSVEVLISALKQIHIDGLPLSHPSCASANQHPDREEGFIFFCRSHWIAYRKVHNVWYNLNSQSNYLLLDPQPVRITEFYLSAQISKLQDEGFQVFVIRGAYPIAGRLAPRANDLQGTYAWYQSADIKSHVELDKESRQKQKDEQRIRTQQLMRTDPQQYNALMRNGFSNGNSNVNMYSLYEQQQQHLAMQQIEAQRYYDNLNEENKQKMSNPFSKLKKIYQEKTRELQEKTKELKNRMSANKDDDQIANNYMNQLEKAKQESMKTTQNRIDLKAMNTPQIAALDVKPPVTNDVDLALALSASMAGNKPQNEVVELEFEMTDHKAKIVMKEQEQHDFLDLMSMGSDDTMSHPQQQQQTKETVWDEDDPFSSLIKQYSENNETAGAMDDNPANGLTLLDFNAMSNTNNGNTTHNADFDNLFGDLNSNINGNFIDLMTPKEESNHKP
eukprot:8568_1